MPDSHGRGRKRNRAKLPPKVACAECGEPVHTWAALPLHPACKQARQRREQPLRHPVGEPVRVDPSRSEIPF